MSISDLEVLKKTNHRNWSSHVIDTTYLATEGTAGLSTHLQKMCEEAEVASKTNQIIVLSDRNAGKDRVPISSLLVLGR